MDYKCSLIITVYNQAEELKLVLESVARQSACDFEVIIADDGSSDHTPDIIEQFQDAHDAIPLKHIWHEDEGFNKPSISNKAVRETSSEYLIFVDGDMILHPRFVEGHLHCRGSSSVLVGSRGVKLYHDFVERLKDGREQINFSTFALIKRHLHGDLTHWHRGLVIQKPILRRLFIKPINRLTGCNFSMYKEAWTTVNGLDNTIHEAGCEDFEFGCRLAKAGYKFKPITKCANTFHMEHSERTPTYGKQIREVFRQNPYITCKHGYTELPEGSTADLFWDKWHWQQSESTEQMEQRTV